MKITTILARGLFLAGVAISFGLTAPAADAQQEDRASIALDEIIVTARKREETLQEAPVSVLAFDPVTLVRDGLANVQDIASRVPGLQFNVSNATDASLFMRGIGSTIDSAAADRAVGVFIDNVFMSRNTGTLLDIFDLERVEVVRGPHSLLFGKNVVGGLIHYVTQKPTQEAAAKLEATVGDYEQLDIRGSARGGLTENVSGSLAFSSRSHAGYADITSSLTPNSGGGDEDDVDSRSVRGQLLLNFSDDVELLISTDYTTRDAGARWVDLVVAGDSEAVTFLSFLGPGGGTAIGVPDSFILADRNAPFDESTPRAGFRNFEGFQEAELWGTSVRFDWQVNDAVTVTSLTAYREADIRIREDGCGFPFPGPISANGAPDISSLVGATIPAYLAVVPDCYFDQAKTDSVNQISQELTIGWDGGGALSLRGGIYYLNEDIDRRETVSHMFQDFGAVINVAFNAAFGGATTIGAGDIDPGGTSLAATQTDADNFGVFGELNYDITDRVSLNAGVRWVRDEKDFTVSRGGVSFDAPLTAGPFTGSDSDSWDEVLPTATLTFAPGDDSNLYFRYARGYKAGGWNGENAPDETISDVSFDPEVADTFEIGGKFELFDNRLRVNLAAYFAEYDDLQTEQFVVFAPGFAPDNVIVNADGTEATGIEADITFAATEWLTLRANYAYTDCEFTESVIVDDDGTDIKGNTCRRAPENAFGIGGEASRVSRTGGETYLRFSYNWTDEYFFDNDNQTNPLFKVEDEYTVDASAGYVSADKKWAISVWGQNLTDELNTSSKLELFGSFYKNYTPPRTYGVTVRYYL